MRRLLWSTVAVSVILGLAHPARGFEAKGRLFLSGGGGAAIPVGDFADEATYNSAAGGASVGFDLNLSLEYGLTRDLLLGGRSAYNRFNNVKSQLVGSARADWTVLELVGLYVKYYALPDASRTRLYGRAGLFLGKPELNFEGSDGFWSGDYNVSLGLDAGIGVTHMFSDHIGASLEGRYAILYPSGTNLGSQNVYSNAAPAQPAGVRDPGGNIAWFLVNGSMVYSF